jgi:hypothetical protein
VTFRSAVVPWLGGGLVVFGYAAFSWLRTKSQRLERGHEPVQLPPSQQQKGIERLSSRLERLPDELALDLDSERLPANNNGVPRDAALGALFLGRASEALSAFHFGPDWPSTPR